MASSETTQEAIDAYAPETETKEVVQTVILNLESSRRKTEMVGTAIDEFQQMAAWLGDHMPSIPERERVKKNSTIYRMLTDAFPSDEREVGSKVVLGVTDHVTATYQSYHSQGYNAERPSFGESPFFLLSNQNIEFTKNDAGYGLKANFIPYNPEWFHINPTPHTKEYLERIINGNGSYGTAEFRLEDGQVTCHLPVKWDVEVYKPRDVTTHVGVDLGENVLYAAAVMDGDSVADVEVKPGAEFRHYRDQLDEKRERLSAQGDLRGVKQCRGERRKYTEQVLDTASREIVDLAVENEPAVIRLEDLTNYRQTASDPIHDWPYADLQEKICYKATESRIPVETVDPRNSSITCRKCGQTNPEYRDGVDFECTRCGYEVHADVNAAINIANREST